MSDITQDFDGPVIEPVKGIGDVTFKRCDWAFWSGWATALKAKRVQEDLAEIAKASLPAMAKMEATSQAKRKPVSMGEVFQLRYTNEGVDKVFNDCFVGGGNDRGKLDEVKRRIGPGRLMELVEELCSEPIPTVTHLRNALRELAKKAHRKPPEGIDQMNDEELIALANDYKPEAEAESGNPLSEAPSEASSTT